jgi:hypothetical protein
MWSLPVLYRKILYSSLFYGLLLSINACSSHEERTPIGNGINELRASPCACLELTPFYPSSWKRVES